MSALGVQVECLFHVTLEFIARLPPQRRETGDVQPDSRKSYCPFLVPLFHVVYRESAPSGQCNILFIIFSSFLLVFFFPFFFISGGTMEAITQPRRQRTPPPLWLAHNFSERASNQYLSSSIAGFSKDDIFYMFFFVTYYGYNDF